MLTKKGCGIADLDFMSAFNLLCMSWVERVLESKGLEKDVVEWVRRIYSDSVPIPVVNGVFNDPI